ncbi:MAG: hypothetical protein IAF08_09525 [Rhizobacter sp.]|nr:hypothetical protein [Chlorobiales bacterium]
MQEENMRSEDARTESKKFEDLQHLTPEDFDGHTEFHRLTAEQKLMWLSQAAQFAVLYGGALAKESNKKGVR